MHEMFISQSIVDTLQSEIEEEELKNVKEVHVKIGVLSCVDPNLLAQVFKFANEGTTFSECTLHTELLAVMARCEQCKSNFKVEHYRFICPACDTPSSDVVQGNELTIYKIIMEEPIYAEADK